MDRGDSRRGRFCRAGKRHRRAIDLNVSTIGKHDAAEDFHERAFTSSVFTE